jgi:hypothetical protein
MSVKGSGRSTSAAWQPRNETFDANFLTSVIRAFDPGFLFSRVVRKTLTIEKEVFVVFDLCSDTESMTLRLARLVRPVDFRGEKRDDLLPVGIGSLVIHNEKVFRLSKMLVIEYWIKAATIAVR